MEFFLGNCRIPAAVHLTFSSVFHGHRDLVFCCFLHTSILHLTVCTSSTFFVPLPPASCDATSENTLRRAVVLLMLWFIGQALWLAPAYVLEFHERTPSVYLVSRFVLPPYQLLYVPSSFKSFHYKEEPLTDRTKYD